MRWDEATPAAAAALITLIAMRRFVRSAALGVTGGGF